MELKLWNILCLLLITCGSAAPDSEPDPALDHTNTTAAIVPPRDPSVQPSPGPGVTNSSNRNTTTGGGIVSATAGSKMDNGSVISSFHPNQTEPPISQTAPLPSGNLTSNTTDPPDLGQTNPADINTTHPASMKPSNQTFNPQTPDPSNPAPLNHTGSSKNGLNETFNGDPPTSAAPPPSKDTPRQRHVGGDTVMVHESPSLDPLLTGLVSAFIITAVFVTLLLFLRRHRRQRSEFSRLQDVSMDDVMEDTPLSMYNY